MPKKQLAVIDATTGTLLASDNLHAVMATEKQLDAASNSDSAARDLAMSHGYVIPDNLLAELHKKPTRETVLLISDIFGWAVNVDADGYMILETSVKAKK